MIERKIEHFALTDDNTPIKIGETIYTVSVEELAAEALLIAREEALTELTQKKLA